MTFTQLLETRHITEDDLKTLQPKDTTAILAYVLDPNSAIGYLPLTFVTKLSKLLQMTPEEIYTALVPEGEEFIEGVNEVTDKFYVVVEDGELVRASYEDKVLYPYLNDNGNYSKQSSVPVSEFEKVRWF